jgi:hypothetical protein
LGSGRWPGRLTVRKAQFPSGKGRPEKQMPAAERQQETETGSAALPPRVLHNWPDTASAEPERGLTRVG